MYVKSVLLLSQVAAKFPAFIEDIALLPWQSFGSFKFQLAYRNACKQGCVCLHIGAGSVQLKGWLNTDISPKAPLYLDIGKRLPIRDNTVSYIFGEHFLEFLPRQAAIGFSRESFRILKPGGVLRISTPDIKAHAEAYLHEPEHVHLLNERNRQLGYKYTQYSVDILNKRFFEDRNVCAYDAEALQHLLESAGFQNTIQCRIGESTHGTLQCIEQHDTGSIADRFTCVVEATKPHP